MNLKFWNSGILTYIVKIWCDNYLVSKSCGKCDNAPAMSCPRFRLRGLFQWHIHRFRFLAASDPSFWLFDVCFFEISSCFNCFWIVRSSFPRSCSFSFSTWILCLSSRRWISSAFYSFFAALFDLLLSLQAFPVPFGLQAPLDEPVRYRFWPEKKNTACPGSSLANKPIGFLPF